MAIYLTNGAYFITHDRTGAVTKVDSMEKAQNFYSVERAIAQKKKAPSKTKGYYYIDTDALEGEKRISKRKKFSSAERMDIYWKTQGHCYLCGEFVDYELFEIEHKIPLAQGGTNDIENLFCSCHTCNTLKGSIAPADLMEKKDKTNSFAPDETGTWG